MILAVVITLSGYFTAEFGHLQYAEVQNNFNDEGKNGEDY